VVVYVSVTETLEIPSKSEALHLSEESRVIAQYIFKWAVLWARLAHQNAACFLHYRSVNHAGPVPEFSDTGVLSDHRVCRLDVALRA
jgi:hypothetical protein